MNWRVRQLIKATIKKLGYEIHKSNIVNAGEYTLNYPHGIPTYSPWFEDWFQETYNKIKNKTVVTEDRCYIINRFCIYCLNLRGDFAECGVYKGGTAFLIANTIKHSVGERCLHLFDTFTGMPDSALNERDSHTKGDFGDTSLDRVKVYLKDFPFIYLHKGLIPNTFETVRDRKFSFVHIDVDLYPTTHDCCQFFYNRLVSGGVMICDDYGFSAYKQAARLAVDEFFRDKPENPISFPTGQCLIIKCPSTTL